MWRAPRRRARPRSVVSAGRPSRCRSSLPRAGRGRVRRRSAARARACARSSPRPRAGAARRRRGGCGRRRRRAGSRSRRRGCRSFVASVTCHAVAGDPEAGEPLDVHVQERAGPRPLVAAIGLALAPRPAGQLVPARAPSKSSSAPGGRARQPAGPEVRLASRPQDRRLLLGRQPPRLRRGRLDRSAERAAPSASPSDSAATSGGRSLARR